MREGTGDAGAAAVRATRVTAAAADRWSASQTAAVYDCRAGTSICEIAKRASRTATANGKVGISGTRINSTLEGTWVKTIVLTSPTRRAMAAAAKAAKADSGLAPEKMAANRGGYAPNR